MIPGDEIDALLGKGAGKAGVNRSIKAMKLQWGSVAVAKGFSAGDTTHGRGER